jgi:hypothetical protein
MTPGERKIEEQEEARQEAMRNSPWKIIEMPNVRLGDTKNLPWGEGMKLSMDSIEKKMNKKRVIIAMLPSKEATNVGICIKQMSDRKIGDLEFFNSPMFMSLEYWQPQHLYILTDEQIQENDWCWCNFKTGSEIRQNIHGAIGSTIGSSLYLKKFAKKIIATTNRSLRTVIQERVIECNLPNLTKDSVELCCKVNRMQELFVEYVDNGEEDWMGDNENGEPFWNSKWELKVSHDSNTIDIIKGDTVGMSFADVQKIGMRTREKNEKIKQQSVWQQSNVGTNVHVLFDIQNEQDYQRLVMGTFSSEPNNAFIALFEYEKNCILKYDRPGKSSIPPKKGETMSDFAAKYATTIAEMKNHYLAVERELKRLGYEQ